MHHILQRQHYHWTSKSLVRYYQLFINYFSHVFCILSKSWTCNWWWIMMQMHKDCGVKNSILGKDVFAVTVYPQVDFAFIVAVVVVLHEINQDREGEDWSSYIYSDIHVVCIATWNNKLNNYPSWLILCRFELEVPSHFLHLTLGMESSCDVVMTHKHVTAWVLELHAYVLRWYSFDAVYQFIY